MSDSNGNGHPSGTYIVRRYKAESSGVLVDVHGEFQPVYVGSRMTDLSDVELAERIAALLNERDRYREMLEYIASFTHAKGCCNCADLGCVAGRAASEALEDE